MVYEQEQDGVKKSQMADNPGICPRLNSVTCNNITLQWVYVRKNDWMPVHHFLLEFNTTEEPEYIAISLAPHERMFTIDNCCAKTKHAITLTAIDINGSSITRSRPLIAETSGPIERPVLQLLHNEPGNITVKWHRPNSFGNAKIKEYLFQVNGNVIAKLNSIQLEATYLDCRPLRSYTFRLQAISDIPHCDSEWSYMLDLTCPGALPTTLERAHSKTTNKIKVTWNKPICQGDARVREFRIYYLKVDNSSDRPSKEEIINETESILHTLSPNAVEDFLKVKPDKYYWAILEAEIVPDGCPNIITPSVQLHAPMKPVCPALEIDVYGVNERATFDKEMAYLVDKRDRLKKNIYSVNNSVLAKGERVVDEEVRRKRFLLHQIEKRLEGLLHTVNQHTGSVSAVVKWKIPTFNEFSEPMGYRIIVNNEIYAENLPLDTKQCCVKLSADVPLYKMSIMTLSDHAVGHSEESEPIELHPSLFRPVRFFCYFNNHNKHLSWPENGGCRVEETLDYERQYSDRLFPQRSFVNERIHAASFEAMSVFDGQWHPLGKHFGESNPTALLFWTKWCASSKRAMEYYCSFAKTYNDEFRLLSCCVFSEEAVVNHQLKVVETMTENNWNKDEGVLHFCACHPGPKSKQSKLRKKEAENSSLTRFYKLLGVPTLVLIDGEGYIAWQGRVFGDCAETFAVYLRHTFSVVTKSDCPIKHCGHCDSEKYGVIYSEQKAKTLTRKDLPIEDFDVMMNNQVEELGEDLATSYMTKQTIPAIMVGGYEEEERTDERNMTATNLLLDSHSVGLRADSQGSSRSRGSSSQRSKSVDRQASGRTTQHTNHKRSQSERRAVSALPNIGRKQEKIVLSVRPKTAKPKQCHKYSHITSRYSKESYVPYNPYRGVSYAKNGEIRSYYSRCGYIPTKPFPTDDGFPKVSWSSNKENKKQKTPSHRERKYMREPEITDYR